MIRSLLAISAAALAVAGCANMAGLAPQGEPQNAADLNVDRSLADARVADTAWPDQDWWTSFGDPQLDALEAEALAGSPTLDAAAARVDRARAAAGAARSALLPQVDGNLESTRQRFSENYIVPPPYAGSWQTASRAALDFGYEFDLLGEGDAALSAAASAAAAAEVDAYTARLMLSVAVAREYAQLARLYDQLDIARDELDQRRRLHELTGKLVDAGIENRIALKQAEAAVPAVREYIAALEESETLTRHRIAALLGRGPDRGLDIGRPSLQQDADSVALPSRLPADLLGRRPDVVANRWRVQAAARDIDAAKARFYPDLNLRVFAGFQSIDLSEFANAGSGIAGIGPAVHLPVFEGGRLRSQLAGADAGYDEAVARYNQSLVEALRDLGDRLAAMHSTATQSRWQRVALDAADEAYELALLRYRGGIGNYLAVLSAQTQVLEQKRLEADLRASEVINRIELVRALGGGFENPGPDEPAI